MTLNDLKNSIPDFAKDVKLNFSSLIINSEYDEELVYGCAYASSLAIGDNHIASIFEQIKIIVGMNTQWKLENLFCHI